jgi:hypothetical protein
LQLQALLDEAVNAGTDPAPLLEERLNEWEEKRTGKVTQRESFNALNAFAVGFYILLGVSLKRWANAGETCPYCRKLNGKVVEVEKFFLEKDTDFQPDGAERPLNVRYNLGHPPAHNGCDCIVVAG